MTKSNKTKCTWKLNEISLDIAKCFQNLKASVYLFYAMWEGGHGGIVVVLLNGIKSYVM